MLQGAFNYRRSIALQVTSNMHDYLSSVKQNNFESFIVIHTIKVNGAQLWVCDIEKNIWDFFDNDN